MGAAAVDAAVRAAAEAMLNDLGPLIEHVTARVWNGVPGYRTVLMDSNDLRSYISSNVLTVLSCVTQDREVNASERDRASHLGESRALQGVPLDALIQSFRTAERAILDQFAQFYTEVGGDVAGQREGVRRIVAVLDAIEGRLVEAYRETSRRIALHYDSAVGDLVTQIALGQGVATEDLDRLAALLKVDPGSPYRAAAARVVHDHDPGVLAQVRHHVTSRLREVVHAPVLTGTWGDAMLLLIPGEAPVAGVLARALSPGHCRYEVVVGLGEIVPQLTDADTSCRQALDALDIALRTGRSRQVVAYDDVLLDLLLARDRTLTDRLVRKSLEPLLDQPSLLQTLRAYLDNDLSTPETAKALSVHQNTIAYRLRRIRELTGRDLRHIEDVLLLRLALRAHDLRSFQP
jgi:hypothetical protein